MTTLGRHFGGLGRRLRDGLRIRGGVTLRRYFHSVGPGLCGGCAHTGALEPLTFVSADA